MSELTEEERQARLPELKALGFNPKDARHRAAIKVADRYGLDPLLREVVLIQGQPYFTRDAYLAIAHASGLFGGIEITAEWETEDEWEARCVVWRKDIPHAFSYTGRYSKKGANKANGREMAVARAERNALRRAFYISGVSNQDDAYEAETVTAEYVSERVLPEPLKLTDGIPADWDDDDEEQLDEHEVD